ncbi:CocE/NonD family hydrolase [Oscillatoria sp. CS-180]|uniref:CocE/NonD family hydrolase n=1 Tax=Oscillatoria sp. CS-180 TaxID=3021720 RepID=UPI00232DE5E7|nr:CocE/NonD family hydrolase [Oscillatoria sp. CS-180]MDB9525274.1 CocE/NonD family hydrolase [Oscillatoria sp. CS-180]
MAQRYSVCPKESVSMLTRDRIRLDADVYRPDAEGPFPVLLMRQPYGRTIASTVVYAHPTWYAAHGFIVVIQDVRGRGTSEGSFRLFAHEVQDGFDTVAWAAKLPQSNGRVGMYGFSYQGMTQLYAAETRPPALTAIAPAMVGYHPYEDWAYENGALLLQAGLGWAIQLAAETARLQGDRTAFQKLYQASRQLPLNDEVAACPDVLKQYAPESFFHDWLSHSYPDDYWQRITPCLEAVDLPMLHIGGWFDPYLRGDLRLYHEMVNRSRYPHPLWIGPWGHIPWGRIVGNRDFGPAANSPVDRLQVQWFSHWLKKNPEEIPDLSTVNLFDMGVKRWQQSSHWPSTIEQRWYLNSTGLASMHQEDGQLVLASADQSLDKPSTPSGDTVDTLVHDPWRPVPSIGGHAAIPAGPFNRAAVDCRSDVLTYTSAPLTEVVSITGQVEVNLYCWSDRPSFDLSITLSEITSEGAVHPLTQGYARFDLPAEQWAICRLKLHPTCYTIPLGRGLRLSISAASYPAYAVNPGTGETALKTRTITSAITTLSFQANDCLKTYLSLPIAT